LTRISPVSPAGSSWPLGSRIEIIGPQLGPVETAFLMPGGRGLVVISGPASVIPNVCTTGIWKNDSVCSISCGDKADSPERIKRRDVFAGVRLVFLATTSISCRVVGTPWNHVGDRVSRI